MKNTKVITRGKENFNQVCVLNIDFLIFKKLFFIRQNAFAFAFSIYMNIVSRILIEKQATACRSLRQSRSLSQSFDRSEALSKLSYVGDRWSRNQEKRLTDNR